MQQPVKSGKSFEYQEQIPGVLVCFQSLTVKLKGLVFVFQCWVLVQFIEGRMYYVFIIVFLSNLGQTKEHWVKIPNVFVGFLSSQWLTND